MPVRQREKQWGKTSSSSVPSLCVLLSIWDEWIDLFADGDCMGLSRETASVSLKHFEAVVTRTNYLQRTDADWCH